uniref:Uncharacterized protein n=1 Tax=Panagrolaimus sp. JU765 TaxID=591449 RepID=A0AC34Q799_9BILA
LNFSGWLVAVILLIVNRFVGRIIVQTGVFLVVVVGTVDGSVGTDFGEGMGEFRSR